MIFGRRSGLLPLPGHTSSRSLDRQQRLEPIESALAVVSVLVIISTFRALLLGSGDDANEAGSILNQIVTFGISALSIGLLVLYGTPIWLGRLLRSSWPILLFSGLAVASVIWSLDPGATLRRALALILFSGLVLYLTVRFSGPELLDRLLIAFAIFIAVGYLAVPIPGQGITPDGILAGTWRGLTGQKNEFGRVCALIAAIAAIVVTLRQTQYPRLWLATGLAALPLLAMSDSKTPLAAAVGALGVCLVAQVLTTGSLGRLRLTGPLAATIAFLFLAVFILAITVVLPLALELLGRDLTFSGRLGLWNYVLLRSEDRPLLGSGFRAFWSEVNRTLYFQHFIWRDASVTRVPFHSHSGFLDVRAELGWIGVGALLVLLLSTIRTIFRGFRSGLTLQPALLCLIFTFTLVFSVTERSFLQYFDPVWFLYLLFYLMAKRDIGFVDEHTTDRSHAGRWSDS